jgi:hypothetical protein
LCRLAVFSEGRIDSTRRLHPRRTSTSVPKPRATDIIDEVEGAVAPIAAGQYRNRVDCQLEVSFGLANILFGPLSFGVLGS